MTLKFAMLKNLKQQDAYSKCTYCTLHIPLLKTKFTIKDDTLFIIKQDVYTTFEVLVEPKL